LEKQFGGENITVSDKREVTGRREDLNEEEILDSCS
jgi:hypothetical protein